MTQKHRHNYRGRGFEGLLRSVERLASSPEAPRLGARTSAASSGSLLGDEPGNRQVAAWFLGPRAENAQLFERLIVESLRDHAFWRRNFHPTDPPAITEQMKRDEGYLDSLDVLNTEFNAILAALKKSAPFFSARYQGHMTWDQTLPGMAGYFAGMLYNQNNVALEASPVTTLLEVEAAKDLCKMLGYHEDGLVQPWGHLTCGGSTANIEALWAARNLKFYPLSLRQALIADPSLAEARELTVTLPSGEAGKLVDLDTWTTLNLGVDEVLALSGRIEAEFGVSPELVNTAISPLSLQNLGMVGFSRRFLQDVPEPVIIVPGSKHYSLPKGAAILGVGADYMYSAPLDVHGRVDIGWVQDTLDACAAERRPVISVVGILGTTEEGLVDDIASLLDLRDQRYRPQNIEFTVHADAAWGGYFAALLRTDEGAEPLRDGPAPVLPMSTYVTRQYENLHRADTITVDPHKTGYLPYPAGAMCYRNGAMRSLIAFEAPYINSDGSADTSLVIGSYGIEGSKPGAAAAGVYLSHAVVPTTQSGYGKILGRTLYNTKMFHYRLLEMNDPSENFTVVPVPQLELEGALSRFSSEAELMAALAERVAGKPHAEILANDEALELLSEIGSDLNIITYAFNFKRGGVLNQDLEAANAFNKAVYQHVGIQADGRQVQDYRVILSTTDFKKDTYGGVFFNDYKRRLLALDDAPEVASENSITVMRSVIMDPWLSEDAGGQPFMDTVIDELRTILRQVSAEFGA
ncbi:decarboxylase [Pseudenhygromyxa sp. WMMC2535]|uniref:pyridoxal phosphate-dependent decarboxylase family protein n=1 Tax=Pseudenhygromyxa sp. WMMC2535 TaxID=2712867 RepID=UPI0015565D38|nr:pyridoxal-dependent decarboxylase [Pseudenhygromyxa sp. WMMC2535]NVB40502.1 decarboxylase [Pseudenhygromyxa sp. WMMC2535]